MLVKFRSLVGHYNALNEGELMELNFTVNPSDESARHNEKTG
jgi:hypothetical protein